MPVSQLRSLCLVQVVQGLCLVQVVQGHEGGRKAGPVPGAGGAGSRGWAEGGRRTHLGRRMAGVAWVCCACVEAACAWCR